MAANTENSVTLIDGDGDGDVQTFLEGKKKTSTRKEKPNVTYSVALITVFLAAESENRLVEDLPWADLPFTKNIPSFSEDEVVE